MKFRILLLAGLAAATVAQAQNVKVVNPDTQPVPVKIMSGGAGGAGDASAANQTAVQATAGSDATKAVSIQGITGGKAVPVSAASLPLPAGAASNVAATNLATSQVTAGAAAVDLAIARATRRQVTFFNTDATNAVFVGATGVTSTTGVKIPAGQSRTFRVVILLRVVAPAGSPVVDVQDEYD